MDGVDAIENRAVDVAVEDILQRGFQFLLPRDAHAVVLQAMEEHWVGSLVFQRAGDNAKACERCFRLRQRRVQMIQQPLPTRAYVRNKFQCALNAVTDQHILADVGVARVEGQVVAIQIIGEGVAECQFVSDRKLDINALDAVAIIAHAWQWDHHVFVELERIGVLRNRRSARAIQPEVLALFSADGDEAFGAAQVAHAHNFGGRLHNGVFIVANQVADQHHLRAAMTFSLGGVTNGLQITLIEVLQAGQQYAEFAPTAFGFEIVGDLDDGRDGFAHLTEEFETDGARVRRHLVQYPTGGDDDAVGTLFLYAGNTAQKLVGDVLAQPNLAAGGARDAEYFLAQ